MKTATLTRIVDNGFQTIGTLTIDSPYGGYAFKCVTLEKSFKNNEKKISCIPTGKYRVRQRNSPKYGWHYEILDVPNRSLILIHAGNYASQTQGCILVGDRFKDINNDNQLDVTNSKYALKILLSFNLTHINIQKL